MAAYEGRLPYIFVSYSHEDTGVVYPIIRHLHDLGYRVWYDGEMHGGDSFSDKIAERIKNAKCFMAFVSEHYVASVWCKREATYATDDCHVNPIRIQLDHAELPGGLAMAWSGLHILYRYRYRSDEDLIADIRRAPDVVACKGNRPSSSLPPPAPSSTPPDTLFRGRSPAKGSPSAGKEIRKETPRRIGEVTLEPHTRGGGDMPTRRPGEGGSSDKGPRKEAPRRIGEVTLEPHIRGGGDMPTRRPGDSRPPAESPGGGKPAVRRDETEGGLHDFDDFFSGDFGKPDKDGVIRIKVPGGSIRIPTDGSTTVVSTSHTVSKGGGSVTVKGGSGSVTVKGGSSSVTVKGGSGSTTVKGGSTETNCGIVPGNVTVESGGVFINMGTINGNVILHGGTLRNFGIVNGNVSGSGTLENKNGIVSGSVASGITVR